MEFTMDLQRVARKMVFDRDGNKCRKCGSKSKLVAHHLKYPANSLDDFATLCMSCDKKEARKNSPNPMQKYTTIKIPKRLFNSIILGHHRSRTQFIEEAVNRRLKEIKK